MNELNVVGLADYMNSDDAQYDSSADLLSLPPLSSPRLWVLPDEMEQESKQPLDESWTAKWIKNKAKLEKEGMHLTQEEIVTNNRGGKQSRIHGDYTLIPHSALEQAAMVLEEGAAKYGALNWKDIPMMSHLNHAYRHITIASDLFHAGRGYPDQLQLLEELSHALVRTMFCIDRLLEDDYDYKNYDYSSHDTSYEPPLANGHKTE